MALSEPSTAPQAEATRSRVQRMLGGGTSGNQQLTATVGLILLVLFLVLMATIIWIGSNTMLWLHLFLGVALVGPVVLKLASTGYRFTRYYSSNAAYRRKGPPHLVMRVLGPFVILTTLGVFVTGLLLLIAGPGTGGLVPELHKIIFYVWIGVVGLHVLWHLPELPAGIRAVRSAEQRTRDLPGSRGRSVALLAALAGGLVLALIFLPDIHSWTAGLAFHPHTINLN
ncbi:MAG TPA: hypothetical protein VHU61_08635 [Solirubrobacteraceae bacterium]|jgi:hypothetical protein|nr:hypothetical protein [Solirubrobacteraceae bacterium]